MATPRFVSIGTTTANSTACTLLTSVPLLGPQVAGVTSGNSPMLTAVSYMIDSAGGTTLSVTFQELGLDGTWRTLSSANGSLGGNVGPPTLTTAGQFSGVIIGQFHGIRLNFTIATATLNYAELKGVVISFA